MTKAIPNMAQHRRNVLFIWANRSLGIVAPLLVTPIITHHFGPILTGVWLLATQLASHLMLLDAGFANSLIRYLARQRALNDDNVASEFLATAFIALICVGLLLLLAMPFLRNLFLKSFDIAPENAADAGYLVMLTVAYVALSLPLRIGYGILSSAHRFDRIQMWEGAGIALRIVLVLTVFGWAEPSLFDLGLIVYGTTLGGVLALFVDGMRQNSAWSIHPSHASKQALAGLGSMGGAALMVTFAQVVLTQGVSIVTGYSLGTGAVVILAFPIMIFLSLTPFFQTFPALLSPIAAALAARGQAEELYGSFLTTARYLASAALLVSIALATGGYAAMTLWLQGPKLKAEDIHTMAVVVTIIFGGYALAIAAPLGRAVLTSVGRHWQAAWIDIATAVAGIVVGYVLMTMTEVGVTGMAVGVAFALLLRGLVFFPLQLSRYFNTNVLSMLARILGRPLAAALVFALIAWILGKILPPVSRVDLLQLMAFYMLPFMGWCAVNWMLVMSAPHKMAIRRRLFKNDRKPQL